MEEMQFAIGIVKEKTLTTNTCQDSQTKCEEESLRPMIILWEASSTFKPYMTASSSTSACCSMGCLI